ncbi:23027_t:CDS:2 [Dentiscutata erythropus]|uniref:23027_t:CDS:1 n=1 Tax=Dentiscutata erythropus TaxID=1348616 RepID=A0A9N8ZUR1_9GLOM|nr:23027_t:CDS:2 [Dentiscutata erythropus]
MIYIYLFKLYWYSLNFSSQECNEVHGYMASEECIRLHEFA